MISAIECVMLTLDELEPGLQGLRALLGLQVARETHASVGLLSAWHHPVHESVRLVELEATRPGVGRLRLARFEDSPAARYPVVSALPDDAIGPRLIDLRAGPPTLQLQGALLAPGGLPVVGEAPSGHAAERRDARSRRESVAWVWIRRGSEAHRAQRFYAEVLGLATVPVASVQAPCPAPLAPLLGLAPQAPIRLSAYAPAHAPHGGVILYDSPAAPSRERPPRRLTEPGISLLSCRCTDLDELIERLQPLGIEPMAAPSHVGLPHGQPGRVMVVLGPSEERLELVETAD